MTTHRVAVVPGDGTGPEVVAEAVRAVDRAAEVFGFEVDYSHHDIGGERYLRTGETLTGADLEALSNVDAVLFGAIGHPKVAPGILEQEIMLRIRRELDLYINLRPIRLHPGSSVRSVTSSPRISTWSWSGRTAKVSTWGPASSPPRGRHSKWPSSNRSTVASVWRGASGTPSISPASRPRRHLTLCGKTNVLTYAWDLWARVFNLVAEEYPDVTTAYAHVDAACLWMVEDPGRFDVIVTDNMFGDIITDLGAAIQGGMGIASGANLNPNGVSMFEPIGGTAPGFEGTGQINPLAAIGAAAMMLSHLGEDAAGCRRRSGGGPGRRVAPVASGREDGCLHLRGGRSGMRAGLRPMSQRTSTP